METTRFQINGYEIRTVPVLHDNVVYLVCRDGEAVLIDAGEAKPVFEALEKYDLHLQKILITHAHHDHIGECRAIQDGLGVQSTSPGVESSEFPVLGTVCRSISTPGHIAIHKLYHFPELGVLFTGDTLINGACGRILDGTSEQLFESLQKIKALPDETQIFGGHDYLVENMRFALSIEPGNADLQARLDLYRTDPVLAIFATLADEKKTNPFLRAATRDEFAMLRRAKDSFYVAS